MQTRTVTVLLVILLVSCTAQVDDKYRYLAQTPPGRTPEKFAPGLISKEAEYEFGSVFNADGTEFYYAVNAAGKEEIRSSRLVGDSWTQPEVILSHERYGYNDPFLSPNEQRLYFISKRAKDGIGELSDYDIWYVEREADGWSEPINAGPNINSSGNEYYISFTKDGTMYFSTNKNAPEDRGFDYDIHYSNFVDEQFQVAVVLGEAINTDGYEADVFIDPEESYIIFAAGRSEGYGRGDLYISFKKPDGTWSASKNMGHPINTEGHELCPFVTSDGKYFFYTSSMDIYWVDAQVIEDMRE